MLRIPRTSPRLAWFDPEPAPGARILVGVFIALTVSSFYWGASSSLGYSSDLDQVWHGSRALLGGVDPYAAVGPGGSEFEYGFPLYYPLPTLMAFAPLAVLPLEWARIVFVGLSAGVLAFAITYDGWHRLPMFLSGAYIGALASAQWSPLLTAAFLVPWLGPALLLKPNIGLAIAASSPTRGLLTWCIAGGGALVLLSLFIDSGWPSKWLGLVQGAAHFTPPVLLPGGFLVLLALLRWRRPEARLLVVLACVPHTTLTYEALPVLLVCRNWSESLLLAGLTFVALLIQVALDVHLDPFDPAVFAAFNEWVTTAGMLLVALLYLPATILVLRRPNEGDLPPWLLLVWRQLPVRWSVRNRRREQLTEAD